MFRIRSGSNPHTRDRWGRRKRVDRMKAFAQWNRLKSVLEGHGVRVHRLPPVEKQTGMVFPANAGFRFGNGFYLSNLNPARAGEREYYREAIRPLGLAVRELPCPYWFEGEADLVPVGDPSGDPDKRLFLFTYGRIRTPAWAPRIGFPPYRRVYGFRSDRRVLPALESIVRPHEVLPLELVNEQHYHGDTALCPFGPRAEHLLVYLPALSPSSRDALRSRLGSHLVELNELDGPAFAANSFQVVADYYGKKVFVLLMPDGLTEGLYAEVVKRGAVPCPVDVSEFLEKGGGAVKCMLLNLGELS